MITLSSDVIEQALGLIVDALAAIAPIKPDSVKTLAQQFEEEANELELALSAFQHHVNRRISTIRHKKMLLVPINRLPPEILVDIFLLLSEDVEPVDRHKTHSSLARVSSRWYSAALSSPRLWNQISNDMNMKTINLMLQRSKNGPLDLFCTDETTVPARRFLDVVIPHVSRWRTFHIGCDNSVSLIRKYLAGKTLPSLESFRIVGYGEEDEEPLNLSAPSLKYLAVNTIHCPFRMEPGVFLNLTKIRFPACIINTFFHLDYYRRILLSAPHLEDVSIYGGRRILALDVELESASDIYLNNLRTLSLSTPPWETIDGLLSSIFISTDEHPQFSVSAQTYIQSLPLKFSQSTGAQCLLSVIRNPDWFSARSVFERDTDAYLHFIVGTGLDKTKKILFDLRAQGSREGFGENLSTLVTSAGFSNIKMMELEGLQLLEEKYLLPIIPSLHYLEVLRVRSSCRPKNQWTRGIKRRLETVKASEEEDIQPLSELLAMLSLPLTSTQPTVWFCPHLRHVSLDCSVDPDSLTELLEARGCDNITSSDSARLEVVEIKDRNEELHGGLKDELQRLATRYHVELWYRDLSKW